MKTAVTAAVTPAPSAPRRKSLLARIVDWILDIDDITPEEARERMLSKPGFFDSLTPEQLEMIRNHEGPDFLGPPITKRNRHLLLHPERHELPRADSR